VGCRGDGRSGVLGKVGGESGGMMKAKVKVFEISRSFSTFSEVKGRVIPFQVHLNS
jgi:hypothetical protein